MRILTWNMQGQGGLGDKTTILFNFLNGGCYDIVCLQEAGLVLHSFQHSSTLNGLEVYTYSAPSHPRGVNHIHEYTALYYQWGTSNNRCSLVTSWQVVLSL